MWRAQQSLSLGGIKRANDGSRYAGIVGRPCCCLRHVVEAWTLFFEKSLAARLSELELTVADETCKNTLCCSSMQE